MAKRNQDASDKVVDTAASTNVTEETSVLSLPTFSITPIGNARTCVTYFHDGIKTIYLSKGETAFVPDTESVRKDLQVYLDRNILKIA